MDAPRDYPRMPSEAYTRGMLARNLVRDQEVTIAAGRVALLRVRPRVGTPCRHLGILTHDGIVHSCGHRGVVRLDLDDRALRLIADTFRGRD